MQFDVIQRLRPITAAEYNRMGEAGILAEDEHVELIDGKIIAMAPIGSDHAGTVGALYRLLDRAVGDSVIVMSQSPVHLDEYSEPQPDFAVLKPRADFYRPSHPVPADVFLLIEVARSSLDYDRIVKSDLYARHGIPAYWIVNLIAQDIEIFGAVNEGVFATHGTVNSSDRFIQIPGFAAKLSIDEILGTVE